MNATPTTGVSPPLLSPHTLQLFLPDFAATMQNEQPTRATRAPNPQYKPDAESKKAFRARRVAKNKPKVKYPQKMNSCPEELTDLLEELQDPRKEA
jgi:hypothetical protein